MKPVKVDPVTWHAGYTAGLDGEAPTAARDEVDYASGFAAGRRARQQGMMAKPVHYLSCKTRRNPRRIGYGLPSRYCIAMR